MVHSMGSGRSGGDPALSRRGLLPLAAIPVLSSFGTSASGQETVETAPYREWRDPETKLRIRRITSPSLCSIGLYHHQRAFTADGRWMLFFGCAQEKPGIYALNLESNAVTRLTREAMQVQVSQLRELEGNKEAITQQTNSSRDRLLGAVIGTSQALLVTRGTYQLLDVPGGERHEIGPAPPDQTFTSTPDVTADASHLVGTYIEMTDAARQIQRSDRLWVIRLWKEHLKNTLFTINLKTGERKDFFYVNSWVDHLQCSPTDPALFSYVDQGVMQRTGNGIHVMRTDGGGRRMVAEGGAHHIWSPDGRYIYYNDEYDRRPPWEYFRWDCHSGERQRVLPREEWNFHFCASPDNRYLVGDGNWDDPYINLYRLEPGGGFQKTRLCRRITGNLRTENQARFSPDGRHVYFNGDENGIKAIFEVEIENS